MKKPENVIYAVRMLYLAAIITFAILVPYILDLGKESSIDTFILFGGLIALDVYFIWLLSKGKFWIRSVFLVSVIIGSFKELLIILQSESGLVRVGLIIVCFLQIRALYLLYKKDSSTWYAEILMEENLKKLAKKKPLKKRLSNLYNQIIL